MNSGKLKVYIGGAVRRRAGGCASHPHGHHDAGDGRPDRHGPAAADQQCAGDPADGQERGHRQGAGAERGRGRLHHQALQSDVYGDGACGVQRHISPHPAVDLTGGEHRPGILHISFSWTS